MKEEFYIIPEQEHNKLVTLAYKHRGYSQEEAEDAEFVYLHPLMEFVHIMQSKRFILMNYLVLGTVDALQILKLRF